MNLVHDLITGKWMNPFKTSNPTHSFPRMNAWAIEFCIPLNKSNFIFSHKPFNDFISTKLTHMPHSFNKIWIHAIWSTKNRMPLIHQSIEEKIYHFISEQLHEQGCPVKIINGMPDHIHCLFMLSPQKSIAEILKQIKGSSSHFINQNNLISEKFAWQTGYAAYSVSESIVEKVFHYIQNQKQHHEKKSSQQEFNDFLKLNKLDNQ